MVGGAQKRRERKGAPDKEKQCKREQEGETTPYEASGKGRDEKREEGPGRGEGVEQVGADRAGDQGGKGYQQGSLQGVPPLFMIAAAPAVTRAGSTTEVLYHTAPLPQANLQLDSRCSQFATKLSPCIVSN